MRMIPGISVAELVHKPCHCCCCCCSNYAYGPGSDHPAHPMADSQLPHGCPDEGPAAGVAADTAVSGGIVMAAGSIEMTAGSLSEDTAYAVVPEKKDMMSAGQIA